MRANFQSIVAVGFDGADDATTKRHAAVLMLHVDAAMYRSDIGRSMSSPRTNTRDVKDIPGRWDQVITTHSIRLQSVELLAPPLARHLAHTDRTNGARD